MIPAGHARARRPKLLPQSPDAVYLDVRTEPEFSRWSSARARTTCPSSSSTPPSRPVSAMPISRESCRRPSPRDTELLVGCQSGVRSQHAAEILRSLGYRDVVERRRRLRRLAGRARLARLGPAGRERRPTGRSYADLNKRPELMAIRITRVYTRTGDRGETALVGGRRVPKTRRASSPTARSTSSTPSSASCARSAPKESSPARGATDRDPASGCRTSSSTSAASSPRPPDAEYEGMWRASEGRSPRALERTIDECQKSLEPLKSFILPGGGALGAFLHQARTVCRRAEIEILALVARRSR